MLKGRFGSDNNKLVNTDHWAGTLHALTKTKPNSIKTLIELNRLKEGNHGSVHNYLLNMKNT